MEYTRGAVDQGLVFGIWPNNEKGGFVHRIDLFNTSQRLVHFLQGQIGGEIQERHRQEKYSPARKTHYVLSIANAQAGIEFVDRALVSGMLLFKKDVAEKYADFLRAKINGQRIEDLNVLLERFRGAKKSSPVEELYLPSPVDLAGRLDENGFIGVQERSQKDPLKRSYAQVRLGTAFVPLGLGLQQKYGGSFFPNGSKYLYVVNEDQATRVLQNALPYLRNMQERAQLALEFEVINRQRGTTDQQRADLINRIRQLNVNPV
ncbi:hypothetical protein A3I48_01755 [Candidatus Daviesbacteria bacterium RIFCSPLOWO2_02_FULL_36_7]|uniref:Uncharacterized protein n=1 Tax=Candidatus Daviesbacteria bacterium RIFCSPLOWO2_02_FULL_36_7 TaxID=1797792 RepID=A0A1F5MFV1_9BACT|nr:MAG: hypothetical protein A3I48_01755 [Candidatus Daviesbacteria bacterium RIFCSPLOWO2_02_FULL_36_7]